jgi:hypothetical protein
VEEEDGASAMLCNISDIEEMANLIELEMDGTSEVIVGGRGSNGFKSRGFSCGEYMCSLGEC